MKKTWCNCTWCSPQKRSLTWKSLSREFSARCRRLKRRRRLSINWTREFARIITNLLCEREFLRENDNVIDKQVQVTQFPSCFGKWKSWEKRRLSLLARAISFRSLIVEFKIAFLPNSFLALICPTDRIMLSPNPRHNHVGTKPTMVASIVVSEESVPFAVQQTKDKP